MKSKQDILNALREKNNISIGKGGFLTMTPPYCIDGKEAEQWLSTALTEFEREMIGEIREKIYKIYDEKYSHPTRDYRAEDEFRDDICGTNGLLSQLEKEKRT